MRELNLLYLNTKYNKYEHIGSVLPVKNLKRVCER